MAENLEQRLTSLQREVRAAQAPKPEAPQGLAALYEAIARWGENRVRKPGKPSKGF